MARRTTPITQFEVEEEITRQGQELLAATEAFEEAIVLAANLEHAYRLKKAKVYLRSTGTGDERKAKVDFECEREMLAYKVQQAVVSATRERLTTFRAHIEWLRTLSANVRAQT